MTTINADTLPRPVRIEMTVVLSCLAFAGNGVNLPLLFGVEFLFGSIATMLGVLLLGVVPAAVIAAVGSLYTILAWGHPYALIIFVLEALVVGAVYQYRGGKLILLDLAYWTLIGAPLVLLFYGGVMQMPQEATFQIALKQLLNGVSNALWASLLFLFISQLRAGTLVGAQHSLNLGDVLFHAFLGLILVAGTPPLLYDAYSHYYEEQARITQQLSVHNEMLEKYLGKAQLDYHVAWTRENTDALGQTLMAEGVALLTSGKVASISESGAGRIQTLNKRLSIWLPSGDMPTMARWAQGRFVSRNPVDGPGSVTSVVSELPAAPLIASIQAKYITLFSFLTGILVLGIAVSLILARWLTKPLATLTQAGVAMDQRIAQGRPSTLPSSRIEEFNTLSSTFSTMSGRLLTAFSQLRESRDAVEREVEQRTRELNDTARLLRSVLDAATEFAIVATDPRGTITIFNSGAERLLGYRAGDSGPEDTPLLFHSTNEILERLGDAGQTDGAPNDFFQTLIRNARERGLDSREWTWLRSNGEPVPVWLNQTPIRSDQGEVEGYLLVAEDITELRNAERMKNEFIATVSHELRTPLTSISGSIRILTGGIVGELPPKAQQMLTIAERNINHLTTLVSDLLDIEKLAAGKMHLKRQTLNLLPLIRQTVENHTDYAAQREVSVELALPDTPMWVNVDPQRLEQALSNLLSNAMKFSPRGENVAVRCHQEAGTVQVTILDQGQGVPEDFRETIFDRFSQVDGSSKRNQSGTGLGLAITRELITKMDGSVDFESTVGEGTRFWLRLPMVPPPRNGHQ